jgi:uncharacterized protein involved in exopolysaccharide biosynthesis
MNDDIEIDLRRYAQLLIKHWWQILIVAIIIAIITFSISTLTTKEVYQASSLVAITKPSYQLNFNSEFQTLNIQPANNAFLDLANSDDVIKQVYDQWSTRPSSIKDLQDFRDKVIQVESGSDLSILKLFVTTENPDDSARLANLWAEALITQAKNIYFNQDQQLTFLEEQMTSAKKDLDQADNALIDFQAQNQLQILTNQLDSVLQNQQDYLALQRNITNLDKCIQGLRSQLVSNSGDQATIGDQLSALLLQLQTFNSQTIENVSTIPLQIQFTDPASFSILDNQAQIKILDNLASGIRDRATQVAEDLKTLEPQILSLQQSVQQYQADQDQLQNTRDIAHQTYTTLAQTVDQTRISSSDPADELQLASSALPPTQPLPRNRLRNTIIAGFLGCILAVTSVLVWDWWRGQPIQKEK